MQAVIGMTILGGITSSLYGGWQMLRGGKDPLEKEQCKATAIRCIVGGIAAVAFGTLLLLNLNQEQLQESPLIGKVSAIGKEPSPTPPCFARISNACSSQILEIFNILVEKGKITCENASRIGFHWISGWHKVGSSPIAWGLNTNNCPAIYIENPCHANSNFVFPTNNELAFLEKDDFVIFPDNDNAFIQSVNFEPHHFSLANNTSNLFEIFKNRLFALITP